MPHIRLALPDDLDAIWALVTRAVAHMQSIGNPQWDAFYPTRDCYAADLARGELYVMSADAGLLGVACINAEQASEYAPLPWKISAPAMVLHRMAVDPQAMRRGVGRRFFSFAEVLARRKGISALHVDTYARNAPMQALMLTCGFSPVGEVHFSRTLARSEGYPCFEKLL